MAARQSAAVRLAVCQNKFALTSAGEGESFMGAAIGQVTQHCLIYAAAIDAVCRVIQLK
jgi:hypothetical protein